MELWSVWNGWSVRVYYPKFVSCAYLLSRRQPSPLFQRRHSLNPNYLIVKQKTRTNHKNEINAITIESPERILKVNETESQTGRTLTPVWKYFVVCCRFPLLCYAHSYTYARIRAATLFVGENVVCLFLTLCIGVVGLVPKQFLQHAHMCVRLHIAVLCIPWRRRRYSRGCLL